MKDTTTTHPKTDVCTRCMGNGYVYKDGYRWTCKRCGGTGDYQKKEVLR